MAQLVPVVFPVNGPLNTTDPMTNRPPGTLVEATDAALRWLGPRRGMTQKTWVYQANSGTNYPDPEVPIFDGNNGHGTCTMRAKRQFNLPTQWTLDTVIRPSGVSHSSDVNLLIFQWDLNGIEAIGLYIKGGGAPSNAQRKLYAVVTPTSSAGVGGSAVTLTGTTQISVGTAIENTHHVRLVRDGASLVLTCDGVTEASSSSLSASQRHEAGTAVSVACHAYLAGTSTGGNHLYAGRIYRTLLRTGAATDTTKGLRDFSFPSSQAVRFAQYGYDSVGSDLEFSPFRNAISWSGMTSSNVSEAAPWFQPGVQGGVYHTDVRGQSWNVVVAGGSIFWRRAT